MFDKKSDLKKIEERIRKLEKIVHGESEFVDCLDKDGHWVDQTLIPARDIRQEHRRLRDLLNEVIDYVYGEEK